VVVGARFEDGAATGVNGNGADNSAADSGAAYVFSLDRRIEATSALGAVASYGASGIDAEDGVIDAVCAPASGLMFSLGTTQVSCTVTDVAGATDSGTFSVTVVDTTPPTITTVDLLVTATGPMGAVVNYTAPATSDLVDGAGTATCLPASGSTFPFGTTTVSCSVADAAGNSASASFAVTVADITPPTIAAMSDVFVPATSAAGAEVTYAAPSTSDLVDGTGVATCAPASGSTFALGATTLTCTATDTAGNTASSSFTVTVTNTEPTFVPPTGSLDQFLQRAYLKASNTGAGDRFGWAVAVSGDTLVVGVPLEDNGNGAVYVFVRSGAMWAQQAHLQASNAVANGWFGRTVAVSGDTVIVGAANEASGSGGAYVFVRSGTTWTQQAHLQASNAGTGDNFGTFVAVSGDTVVVGAPFEASNATGVNGNGANNSANGAGAAYVFVRSGTTWTQQAYLKASNTDAGDRFGWTVAVSGDTLVVGAPYEDSTATGVDGDETTNAAGQAGAAYVFVRSGTTWAQQAYLKASNAQAADYFGYAVSVSGDTIVVGAVDEASAATGVDGNQANNSVAGSGAAYVFVRSGSTWAQEAYLKASNTGAWDQFGFTVAVSGDTIVVGSRTEDSSATGVNGNGADNSAADSGAAYVFVRNGTTWAQRAYLKASNTDAGDFFGATVAVSGDTVVVGARFEDSAATGVNGNGADNSAEDSGAAYVFSLERRIEATSASGAVVTYSAVGYDAEDGVIDAVCTPASGETFALGTTHVNCTVTDSVGATDSGTFEVTVVDTTPPTIAVTGDIVMPAASAAGAVVTYEVPVTSDQVDGVGAATCAPASGSTFALGATTVTCTATDGSGNSASTSFDVTVVQLSLDVLSITMETRRYQLGAPSSGLDAVNVYHGLPLGLPGYAPGPVGLPLLQNVNNTLVFGGANNLLATHYRIVIDVPMEGPLDIRVGTDMGRGGVLLLNGDVLQFRNTDMYVGPNPNWLDPNQFLAGNVTVGEGRHVIEVYGFENCCDGPGRAEFSYMGSAYVSFAAPANDVPVVAVSGPSPVSYTSTQTYSFVVTDDDASFSVVDASCGIRADRVGPLTLTPDGGSFECAFHTQGFSQVTVQVDDDRGARSSIAALVVSVVNNAPTVTVPASQTVEATSANGAVATFTATGDDVEDGAITPVCAPASGSTFAIGTTSVTCTVTDSDGAMGSGTFDVTVVDTTPPSVAPMSDISEDATSAAGAVVTFTSPVSSDVVDGAGVATCLPASGSTFALGVTTVTCTATDMAGNSASTSFDVTVVPPSLDVLSITMETREWTTPVPTSGLDAVSVYQALPLGLAGYAPGPVGLTLFQNVNNTIIFGGVNNSLATHYRVVIDVPMEGPLDIRVGTDMGSGGALLLNGDVLHYRDNDMYVGNTNWTEPDQFLAGSVTVGAGRHVIEVYGFEGCCDGPGTTEFSYMGSAYMPFAAPENDVPVVAVSGASPVSYTSTHTYAFTVTDDGASFVVVDASCGVRGDRVGPLTLTSEGGSFACAFHTQGLSQVTVQVDDDRGARSSIAVVAVSVINNAPTVTVPGPQILEATSGTGAIAVFTATGDDVEDGPIAPVCAPVSGATFPLGTTSVSCTVTDSAGATASGMFEVTVVDTTAPTIAASADITVAATSASGATVTFTSPATSDLVDGAGTATCAPASGSTFALGATTVTCTATDAAGNSASSTFTVTVTNTAPAFTAPANITAEATSAAGVVVTYTAMGDDIEDGPIAAACSVASGSTFPLGPTTVSCTVTDSAGASASGAFTVTVVDTTAPTIVYSGNAGTYQVSDTINITCAATDAVGVVSTTCVDIVGSATSFEVGVNTVTSTATDAAGNTGTASTTFTVVVTSEGLQDLITEVVGESAPQLVSAVQSIASAPNATVMANRVTSFKNQVNAQLKSGKITTEQAALLNSLVDEMQ